MIDIESQVFTIIATALRNEYEGIYVAGEYVLQPPAFPAVMIEQMDNTVHTAGRDTGDIENFADVMFQVDVYSNRTRGKKAEAKSIMGLIDEQFSRLGFTRMFLNPVQNINDTTIYRMTGRYRATVGKDETIYRR